MWGGSKEKWVGLSACCEEAGSDPKQQCWWTLSLTTLSRTMRVRAAFEGPATSAFSPIVLPRVALLSFSALTYTRTL